MPLAAGGAGAGADLDPRRLVEFERHVRSCLSCYRELREYGEALQALRPLRAPADSAPPEGLEDAILAGVARMQAGEPGPLAPHPAPFYARPAVIKTALPAAALLLISAVAGLLLQLGGAAPQPPGEFERPPARIPEGAFLPVVRTVEPGPSWPADQLGDRYVFPAGLHRVLLESDRSLKIEPLPPAVVPVSNRNDY